MLFFVPTRALLLGALAFAHVSQALVPLWGQCGGMFYQGEVICAEGDCIVANPYYSQCLPGQPPPLTGTPTRSVPTSATKSVTTTCPPAFTTWTGTATSGLASMATGRPIQGNFNYNSTQTVLQVLNYSWLAVMSTSGSKFSGYSATGYYLHIIRYFNNCKIPTFLNIDQNSPNSYKRLYFSDYGVTNYWAVSPGVDIGTTASSPYGVITDFISCGFGLWDLYLQTGTDLPPGVTCSDPFKLRLA